MADADESSIDGILAASASRNHQSLHPSSSHFLDSSGDAVSGKHLNVDEAPSPTSTVSLPMLKGSTGIIHSFSPPKEVRIDPVIYQGPPAAPAAERTVGSRPRTARLSKPKDSRATSAPDGRSHHLNPPPIVRPKTPDGPAPLSKLPPPAPGTAHRRYSSVYPCANRLLAKRWDDAARDRHRQKLATIKAYIDNTPPKRHGHLQLRLKKLQLEDENLGKIERENLILLERMSRQMSAPQGFSGIDSEYRLKKVLQKPPASERKKKEEKQQIEQANLMLMQRVEAREPHYHQELWDEERRTNLSYFQRISRFPEGYQHILDREGVPPPLKGKLPIRMNRSELLRKSWFSKTAEEQAQFIAAEEHSAFQRERGRPATAHKLGEVSYPQNVKVHQTKTDKLRKQFIKLMGQGLEGRKKWYEEHGTSTSDPLDIASSCARSLASSARSSPDRNREQRRARSQSPGKLQVRENRAQRLRLEEKKRVTPSESLWHPAHLGNVEARIDFGQGGWSSGGYKGGKTGEFDREALIANMDVDETEYEPENLLGGDTVSDFMHDERTWDSVLMGIALREGCKLPISYPTSIRIYWSSEAECRSVEYDNILQAVIRNVKETADLTGVEFLMRDLRWGCSRQIIDSQKFVSVCLNELDSYISSSLSIHFIVTLSNAMGPAGFLPNEMGGGLFDFMCRSVEEEEEDGRAVGLLKKWYRLDTNAVPPKYVLQNISALLPDFAFAADPKVIADVEEVWVTENKTPLLEAMKKVASKLKTNTSLNKFVADQHDTEAIAFLTDSLQELEACKGIHGPTEDAILILKEVAPAEPVTEYQQTANRDDMARLARLRTKLDSWLPSPRKLLEKVEDKLIADFTNFKTGHRAYCERVCEGLSTILDLSLHKISDRWHLDFFREEVLLHTKHFRELSSGFIGRTRMVNRVSNFFSTRYRYGIPPFAIYGPQGVGKGRLLCQGLKKYLNELFSPSQAFNPLFLLNSPTVIVRFVNLTPESSTHVGLLSSVCRQIRRANSFIASSGLRASMSNMTDAVLSNHSSPLFDPDYIPSDLSGLQSYFRACLRTATSKKPIIIALIGVDKVTTVSESLGYGWLPVEDLPPHVYLSVTMSNSVSEAWDSYSSRIDLACSAMTEANQQLFGEPRLLVEPFDIPSCQVALTRWLRARNRTISLEQRRGLLNAAVSNTSGAAQAGSPPSASPLLLKLHFNLGVSFKSWEQEAFPGGGTLKVIDAILGMLERAHGKTVVERFFRIACLLRDGVSEGEMEDLLSVDATILSESVISQLPYLKPSEPPVPRVSTIVLAGLIADVLDTYGLMRRVSGRGRGPPLLKFSHTSVKDAAGKRYLSDLDLTDIVKGDICSYFSGSWTLEEEERESVASQIPRGPRISIYLKGANPNGGDWKGLLNPYKYIMKQPTCLSSADTFTLFNYRKIRELPRMLMLAQKWAELQRLFEDYYFIEGLLRVSGIELAKDEINFLLAEGRRNSIVMPVNIQIHLRHFAIFLRYRLPWISSYEATPSMHPDGLWLQEMKNLPTSFNGVFAEALISSIEENWTDIMGARSGRIEFENGWKPDFETYCPMPFSHINVQCCAVSSDGRYIATGSGDGILKVWDVGSGEEVRTYMHFQPQPISLNDVNGKPPADHTGSIPTRSGITAVCFSSEKPANVVVSAAHDPNSEPSIKLWSWRTPSYVPKTMLGAHAPGSMIMNCDFLAPENRRLMSVGSDLTVVLWEVARGRIIRIIPVPQIDEIMECNGHLAAMVRKSSVPIAFKRRRLHPSGWPRVFGCVGPNGLFAYGSSTISVMDSRWRELFTKDLSSEKEKLRRQRLTAAAFSADSASIFAASATPPDDVQMLSVEIQARAERQFGLEDDGKANFGRSRQSVRASSTQISDLTSVSQESEAEVKRLKLTCIRSWNIESGQQLMMFMVEDYITSLAFSSHGAHLLCGSGKGLISVWDAITGEHVLTREGHTAQVSRVIWFPPQQKSTKPKRKQQNAQIEACNCDDMWTYTASQNLNMMAASKSKSLNSMFFNPPEYQFISVGLDDTLLAWSLDGVSAEPGLSPIITAVFNHTGEWLLTIGGAPLSSNPRANTLVRLWETSTATVRCRIELPETQRSEVIWASFLPRDDTRIVLGCKNGLVKLYRSRTGELVREFWADPETALSDAVLGYPYEWPFAATGTFVIGYSLHPDGKVLAVAIAGQERFPVPAATSQDPKTTYSLEAASQNARDSFALSDAVKLGGLSGRKSVMEGTDPDKSSDMILRDCIRVTFWDLDGNPLRIDSSFNLPIFYNASDNSCTFGPASSRPSLTRLSNFVLKWSHDGRSLYVSDDVEILKECTVEIRGSNVYGQTRTGWWWKSTVSPPPSKMTVSDCLSPSINAASISSLAQPGVDHLDVSRTLTVSAATACSSVLYKGVDNLCFAYGNGIIGWRKVDVQRGGEEVRWFLGHCGSNAFSGGVVGCEYIPNITGKGSYSSQPKHGDPTGLIVSASKNGTVLIQSLGISDRLRIVLSKADGTLALLRYFP
ncbi:hypothetical protein HDU67_009716 [Dinochytrium kinnereticum]|nr:hypothetical protein HDU67_009716 [Dinochytrium kinnereticum]